MFRTISIEGFRGFRSLRLTGLGRVNLLVGSNNSGKTSVLEAVQVLATGGDVAALLAGLRRRDERAADPTEDSPFTAFDARHLFHGRSLDGTQIRLEAVAERDRSVAFSVTAPRVNPADEAERELWRRTVLSAQRRFGRSGSPRQISLFEDEVDPGVRAPRFLLVTEPSGEVIGRASLLQGASLVIDEEQLVRLPRAGSPVQFVGTQSLVQPQLARLLDRAVLADELPAAIAALSTVEDGISRLAAVDDGRNRRIVVGIQGAAEPVPLGSMGEGMSRMLALALSLVAARDGYLLVDEIDTGLHHSVMRKMWRLVFEAAVRLNVAVYATTHSHDCVQALSEIAKESGRSDDHVALLRIERGRTDAVHFPAAEIARLAEREIEPR